MRPVALSLDRDGRVLFLVNKKTTQNRIKGALYFLLMFNKMIPWMRVPKLDSETKINNKCILVIIIQLLVLYKN